MIGRARRDRLIALAGLVLALAVVNVGVARHERLRREGSVVRLALVPVDPRSLMQGDYMDLRYAIESEVADAADEREAGTIVVSLDQRHVAEFSRLDTNGERLATREVRLRFERRGGRIHVAPVTWFFQEGRADRYAGARFAELRVDAEGHAALLRLLDEALAPL